MSTTAGQAGQARQQAGHLHRVLVEGTAGVVLVQVRSHPLLQVMERVPRLSLDWCQTLVRMTGNQELSPGATIPCPLQRNPNQIYSYGFVTAWGIFVLHISLSVKNEAIMGFKSSSLQWHEVGRSEEGCRGGERGVEEVR